MDKSLAANQKLMKNYLSELLTEDVIEEKAAETEKLNKLLQSVTVTEVNESSELDTIVTNKSADTVTPEVIPENLAGQLEPETQIDEFIPSVEEEVQIEEAVIEAESAAIKSSPVEYRKGSFQAMFFDVAGLTVAVPLVELGGIHNLIKTTPLMGKPAWFAGVMLHREEKINVVDTALWVMPEKYDDELKESLNYQFVIMLNNSKWGLQAESLVDTITLQPEDVKWNDSTSKRPWLAGLVKDRMCALLDVEALIGLLNNGINVQEI